jgi:asparagine synthase (glutamine-hydrolysing)
MFAGFSIDLDTRTLIVARDKTGEKPIFIRLSINHIEIASELFRNDVKHAFDPDSLLDWRSLPESKSVGTQIIEVPPGHYMRFNLSKRPLEYALNQYWSWPKRPKADPAFREPSMELYEAVLEAVKKRLVSDVQIAGLFSGGIDSSIIAYFANQVLEKEFVLYSLKFPNSKYDETEIAKCKADANGWKHRIVTMDYLASSNQIDEVLNRMDLPIFDSACLSLFYLSKVVSEEFKVALTGDGGDELFCGYALFRFQSILKNFRLLAKFSEKPFQFIEFITRLFPEAYLGLNLKVERFLTTLLEPSEESLRIALSPFSDRELWQKIQSNFKEYDSHPPKSLEDFYQQTILPGTFLVKADRMSMAHGLELRAPFLDSQLINIAMKYPLDRLAPKFNKFPLRELHEGLYGPNLSRQSKHGFSVPFQRIKYFYSEPNWQLSEVGIPTSLARNIWQSDREIHSQISWSLLVLNHFLNR